MSKYLDPVAHELGFKDWGNMLASALGWKSWVFSFVQISAATVSVLVGFAEEWLWNPPSAIFFFAGLVLSESLSGTLVALKVKKEKFSFRKFYNILPKMVAQLFFLIISFNLAKYSPVLFWLPNATFSWFSSRNLLATGFNCAELGWVKWEFMNYLKTKLTTNDQELADSMDKELNQEQP